MRPFRAPAAVALVVVLCSCASGRTTAPVSSARPPVDATPAQLVEAFARELAATPPEAQMALVKLGTVLWQQTAAEHDAACLQAYATASRMLDVAAADPTWTAIESQGDDLPGAKPPALIIDIDETILDNSAEAAREILWRQPFNEENWGLWLRQGAAKPLPGAAPFLAHAAGLGVEVFYVTNTDARFAPWIERKLRAERLPLAPGHLLTLDTARGWTGDKTSRRLEVSRRYRVLLLIGDDLGDFVSITGQNLAQRDLLVEQAAENWGSRWILIPNPQYGSWQRALGTASLPPANSPVVPLLQLLDAALPPPPDGLVEPPRP